MSEEELTETLRAALEARFGETVEVPGGLDGLEALAGIAGHRTHRRYRREAIEAPLLRLVAAVALSAPSKSDLQQADIVVVSDPVTRAAIAELIPKMPWIAEAAAFLVVCGNGRRLLAASEIHGQEFANDHLDHFFNASVDAALVLQNLIVAAEAVGLGTCPISVIRNHADKVSKLLDLPERVFPVAGLCLGRPAEPGRISPRLPLSATLHHDRHDAGDLSRSLSDYDRRRGNAEGFDPQGPEFQGWSEAKARMYAVEQRRDFGAFIRQKGYRLD